VIQNPIVTITRDEAVSRCSADKGVLTSIHSEAEQTLIASKIVNNLDCSCTWIGLEYDKEKELRMKWHDGSPLDFTYACQCYIFLFLWCNYSFYI